jgi:adenosylcobinamide-GDP ribazoletransferase
MSNRASPLVSFAAALQFLTVIPPLVRRLFTDAELGASVAWFPLVGGLLGAVLALVDLGLRPILPVEVAAVLVLAAWVVLTGGLHLDGYLDSCDALFGGHTREARLEILRDERVGAFAVAGGVLLMLLKFAALAHLARPAEALVLACATGRWLMTLALLRYPYARAEGLGRTMKDHAGLHEGVRATLLLVILAIAVDPAWGAIAMLVAIVVGALAARLSNARLGGLTGDSYGAVCELGEAAVLVAWSACEKVGT